MTHLNEPLQFTTTKAVHLRDTPFRNLNTPMASVRIGMKRSGKGVSMDKEVAIAYENYLTCIWLHSAGGFENLYTIVNKDCRTKYTNIKSILKLFPVNQTKSLSRQFINESIPLNSKVIEQYLGIMKNSDFLYYDENIVEIKPRGYKMLNGEYLHCDCRGRLDTLWIHPDYIIPNKFTFDWFNGYYFKTFEEYNDAYIHCKVNEFLPESYFLDKNYKKNPIRKPKSMADKIRPIIVTKAFTPPTHQSKVQTFREQIREAVLFGREDHRIITNTSSSFPETHQGKKEKYSTIAEFLNYIPELVQRDFQHLDLNKPRDKWTLKERSWWKIALFLGEVREIAPSAKLSGDQESGISKRALFNFMPKSRHNQTWVYMDLQPH